MSRVWAWGLVWRGGLRSDRSPPSRGVVGRFGGEGTATKGTRLRLGHGQADRAATAVPLFNGLIVSCVVIPAMRLHRERGWKPDGEKIRARPHSMPASEALGKPVRFAWRERAQVGTFCCRT